MLHGPPSSRVVSRPCFDFPLPVNGVSQDSALQKRSPSLSSQDLARICSWVTVDPAEDRSPVAQEPSHGQSKPAASDSRKSVDSSRHGNSPVSNGTERTSFQQPIAQRKSGTGLPVVNTDIMVELKENLRKYSCLKRDKPWDIAFTAECQPFLKRRTDPMLSDNSSERHGEETITLMDSSSPSDDDETEFKFSPTNSLVGNEKQAKKGTGQIQLYSFLIQLLDNSEDHCTDICWIDRQKFQFKILKPSNVAKKWGVVKQKPSMTYEKLSRALRYYYKKGIIEKVPGHQYVYCFIGDVATKRL